MWTLQEGAYENNNNDKNQTLSVLLLNKNKKPHRAWWRHNFVDQWKCGYTVWQILRTANERRETVIVSSSICSDWCWCADFGLMSFLEIHLIYICGEKTAPGKSGTVTKSQEPRDLETSDWRAYRWYWKTKNPIICLVRLRFILPC